MVSKNVIIAAIALPIVLLVAGVITLGVLYGEEVKKNDKLQDQIDDLTVTECVTTECVEVGGTILSAMDRTANPCEDFYQYACGGYERMTNLPAGYSKYSKFSQADDLLQKNLRDLLEPIGVTGDSVAEKKARDYYHACLDEAQINAEGKDKLKDMENALGGLYLNTDQSLSDSWTFAGMLHKRDSYSLGQLFGFYITEDMMDVKNNVLMFSQASLGMGRDYYLVSNYSNVLAAYKTMLKEYATLLVGDSNVAQERIDDVVDFEIQLANISLARDEMRDPLELYKNYTLKDLNTKYPNILDFTAYFETLFGELKPSITVEETERVVLYGEKFFDRFDELLNGTTIADVTIQNYVVLRVLAEYAPSFGDEFKAVSDTFNEVLTGTEGSLPRWQICVSETDSAVGSGLGSLYVDRFFPEESKVKIQSLIDSVTSAFKSRLQSADWMDEPTKKRALEKMQKLDSAAAYPDYIKDDAYLEKYYEDFLISDSYVDNQINNYKFVFQGLFGKIHNPVDSTIWYMTPQTVNAYYSPTENKFVIPAGILTGPFFYQDISVPDAINYAAIGTVIGHEIGHGFDDSGSQYNGDGNLENWWSEKTLAAFNDKAQCLVDQYNKYEYYGVNVNGELTLGENIGDNGGLQASYLAYQTDFPASEDQNTIIGMDMTPEKLFFVSYAQVWCSRATEEYIKLQILTDPHSPASARVNGPVTNHEEFAKAFGCAADTPMSPPSNDRCVVW